MNKRRDKKLFERKNYDAYQFYENNCHEKMKIKMVDRNHNKSALAKIKLIPRIAPQLK